MTKKLKDENASPRDRHTFRDPLRAQTETDVEAGGETPIDAKVRLAREAEAYRVDPHRKRDKVARLSPMMLLVLIALAFGVAALLLVYGGFL